MVLMLATVACSSPVADDAGSLNCGAAVDRANSVPSNYSPILDSVAIPSGILSVTQLDSGRWWAKSGLYVRAGVTFSISVKDGTGAGETTIGWGDADGASDAFGGGPCAGEEWLAFIGGYTVETPQCLTLVISNESGDSQEANVGVGAQC